MKKIAVFVFNDDPMCFTHVLLRALDIKQKEYDAGSEIITFSH